MLGSCFLSKEKGGLGVRNLAVMNKALLGKWAWRFVVEDNLAWKEVIKLKYQVEEGGWFTRNPRASFSVSLWKDINGEARKLKQDLSFCSWKWEKSQILGRPLVRRGHSV